MRLLVIKTTGEVIARIDDEKKRVIIEDDFLKKDMLKGVRLQPFETGPEYGGKTTISLNDEHFYQAFTKIYCAKLDQNVYAFATEKLQKNPKGEATLGKRTISKS